MTTPVRLRIENALSLIRAGGYSKDVSRETGVTLDILRKEMKAAGLADNKPKKVSAKGKTLCIKCGAHVAHPGAKARPNYMGYLCEPCMANHMRMIRRIGAEKRSNP